MHLTVHDLRQLARDDKSSRHLGWPVKLASYWAVLVAATAAFLFAAFALIPAWKASAPSIGGLTAPGIDLVKEAADPGKRGPLFENASRWVDGLVMAPLRAQLRPDPNFYFRQRANERAPDWLALAQSKSAQRPIDIKAAQIPFAFVPPPAPAEAVKSVVALVKRPAPTAAPPPTFEPPRFEAPRPEPVAARSHAPVATFTEPPAQERRGAEPVPPPPAAAPFANAPAPGERPAKFDAGASPASLWAQAESDYRALPAVAAALARKLPDLPIAERRSTERKLAEAKAHYAAALAERATLRASDRPVAVSLSGSERQAFDACLAANPAIEMVRLLRKPTQAWTRIPAYFLVMRKAPDGAAGLASCLQQSGIAGSFALIGEDAAAAGE
jgi:hypothetical protein